MATGGPTSALLNAQRMIRAANQQASRIDLLEMAFQTKVRVAHREEFCVYRAVRGVTNGAAFARGFVLENVRATLRLVTSEAALVLREQ